jgi:hypothetical protein
MVKPLGVWFGSLIATKPDRFEHQAQAGGPSAKAWAFQSQPLSMPVMGQTGGNGSAKALTRTEIVPS